MHTRRTSREIGWTPSVVRVTLLPGRVALVAALTLVAPAAFAQGVDPGETGRTAKPTPEKPPPKVRTRPAPKVRTRPAPKPARIAARVPASKKAAGKKPPKRKARNVLFYVGADLSILPGLSTSRTVLGAGTEVMPRTAAIQGVHASALRFIQGFRFLNRTLDFRLAVGVANLQTTGGRESLWGSDLGLGIGLSVYRRARLDVLIVNSYRLQIVTGPDDKVGFGMNLEMGVGVAYRVGKRNWVEVRLGYAHQQLLFREDGRDQVATLDTPNGSTIKTHALMFYFAFLHYR